MVDTDDNFVEFGTPLEPLEEDEVPSKKPITVADQIATDEQGRRRFHGAFTGGFSAGYYNTVGSKEGWTPSTFKSSRKDKVKKSSGAGAGDHQIVQNVQDFMDEEDLGAFGIAPQIIRPTNDFEQRESVSGAGASRKRGRPAPGSAGPIPGMPVLDQIIQPVKDTIGIKILQRMGWRPGQGIGPRLSKKERKKGKKKPSSKMPEADVVETDTLEPQSQNQGNEEPASSSSKIYGCFLPPELRKDKSSRSQSGSEESDDDDGADLENFTFPPDDIDNILCNPKENSFGLGYSGLDRNTLSFGGAGGPIDLFSGPELKSRVNNKKLNIRGEAFGIGVFEDAEDSEVYHRSDMSQYDFSLETPEERKARRIKDKKDKNSRQRERDSKNKDVIEGFIRAKNPPPEKKFYPPPYLPKNFVPIHSVRKSRFEDADPILKFPINVPPPPIPPKPVGHCLNRHGLSIQERQVLLGEEKIPITKAEQEEKVREDEEKIKREKAERLVKFAEILQTFSTSSKDSTHHAFKPFMKNPEKQDRYEKYMALVSAGYQDCLQDLQPPEMTEWEREREKLEFTRAKALYKPISNVMSSRFVSAKSHDISHVVPSRETIKAKDPTQDPKVAAKMNLFGKLTHRVHEWHPDRLFSRRMNVPHPYPESKMVGIRKVPEQLFVTGQTQNEFVGDSSEGGKEILALAPARGPGQESDSTSAPGNAKPNIKKSLFDNLDFSKPPPGLLPISIPAPPVLDDSDKLNAKPQGNQVSETEEMQTSSPNATKTRPPIDLFKQIFENSSSDEEESEDEEDDRENKEKELKSNLKKPTTSTSHRIRNQIEHENKNHKPQPKDLKITDRHGHEMMKVKGIFDNLDLEKLKSKNGDERDRDRENSQSERNRLGPSQEINSEEEEDILYGPKPPTINSSLLIPNLKLNNSSSKKSSSSTSQTTRNSSDSINSFHYTPSSSTTTPRSHHVPNNKHNDKSGNVDEDDEDEWVEKSHSRSSSSSRKKKKKEKKSKSKATHRLSSSSKSSSKTTKKKKSKSNDDKKQQQKKKKKKERKSHKHKKQQQDSSSSDDSNSSSDSEDRESNGDDEDGILEGIKLHQSSTNRELLTKLKELTKKRQK